MVWHLTTVFLLVISLLDVIPFVAANADIDINILRQDLEAELDKYLPKHQTFVQPSKFVKVHIEDLRRRYEDIEKQTDSKSTSTHKQRKKASNFNTLREKNLQEKPQEAELNNRQLKDIVVEFIQESRKKSSLPELLSRNNTKGAKGDVLKKFQTTVHQSNQEVEGQRNQNNSVRIYHEDNSKVRAKQNNLRKGRQFNSANGGDVMYLSLGGAGNIRCPTAADAAAVSIAQMTFLATSLNILSIVININNNLNNNNNNNNKLNINAQSNNNIVSNTNVNNGNQVNVMVPVLNP